MSRKFHVFSENLAQEGLIISLLMLYIYWFQNTVQGLHSSGVLHSEIMQNIGEKNKN